ncbi:hypothetical protein C8Q74DRAFT_1451452 [Fomes fomentarius]|nr:hypothetical protein C8Q74DRAFT_1451452 [Fomes fomentarius]
MTNAVDALLPAVNDLLRAIRTSLSETTDLRDDRDSVARVRFKILRSIEACMGALTDLKTSLNSLTAIGRIPNEIVVHIMGCAARSSFDSVPATSSQSSNLKSDQHPLHWIRLTHVCRTWRAVALDTPALWGHLHYTREDVFPKLLARSKQAPLRSDRLRELHLYGHAELIIDFCQIMQLPMPVLHTLALTAINTSDNNLGKLPRWFASGPQVSLSGLIPRLSQQRSAAQQQLPLLRHLELSHIPIPWSDSLFLLRLTSLVITGCSPKRRRRSGSPVSQLLDLLDSLAPSLENLDLGKVACGQGIDSDRGRVVELPHLRSLTLSGETSDCATLFNHLRVPDHARITLDTSGTTGIERLTRKLSEHYSPPSHTLREAHVHSSLLSVQPTLSHCHELVRERLSRARRPDRLPCRARAVWQLDSGELYAHVPDLARLTLEGAHFRSPASANSSLLSGQGQECFDMMREWLARRASYGIPLEELHLKRCVRLHAKDVEVLREHVSRVEWDGVVEHHEGADDDETGKVEPQFDLDGHINDHELCIGVVSSHPLSNMESMSGGDAS